MEKSLLCVSQLLLICFLTSGSNDAETVIKTVGEDCDLTVVPVGEVIVLECTKTKLDVFVYKNGKISKNDQDQQFKNRVQLRDTEMKNGNIAVTLKSLTLEDAGIYICKGLVQTSGGRREIFTSSVHLSVSEETGSPEAQIDKREEQNLDNNEGRATDSGITWPVIAGILVVVSLALIGFGFAYIKRNQIKDLLQKWKMAYRATAAPESSEQKQPINV